MLTFDCHFNRPSRRSRSAPRRLRPSLEELESRTVPSVVHAEHDHPDDDHACEWANLRRAGPEVKLDLVALHEFGHSLGLDHSSAPGSIMGPSYLPVANYNKANLAFDPAVIVNPDDSYSSLLELFSDAAIAANTTSWKDSLDASPGNGVVNLTFSFMPDGVQVEGHFRGRGPRTTTFATFDRIFGAGNWQSIFVGELNRWASVSAGNLSFSQVSDNGAAFGTGANQNDPNIGDIRIGTHRFDNAGGVLAHAFFPFSNSASHIGDAHFDDDENWINGDASITVSGQGHGHGGGIDMDGPPGVLLMSLCTFGTAIGFDGNAFGRGRFVDLAASENSEFDVRADRGNDGRMDRLTALALEVGQLLRQERDEPALTPDKLTAGIGETPVGRATCDWLASIDAVIADDELV